MALQDIIDSAVNIEVNRSKLVAQNVSRSGRISTNSRNWTNPYRFVVTPKPIWTTAEYRAVFEPIFNADRFEAQQIRLSEYDNTTGLPTNNAWITQYQGGADISTTNGVLDGILCQPSTAGTRIVMGYSSTNAPVAGTYIVKKGDWVRPFGYIHPYQATEDIIMPTAATGITGTITAAGTTEYFTNTNLPWTTTDTRTTITGITSTAGLSVGQIITESGTNTGSFGGVTYIAGIESATKIIIQSTTANTAGAITFNGSARTDVPNLAIPIHRGFLGTISSTPSLPVGARAAQFNVMVTKLPQIRYLPGQLIEFTSDFELIESILPL
jgi:hypothetical protein